MLFRTPFQQYWLYINQYGKAATFDYFWRDVNNEIWSDVGGDQWTTE
jgi:hypothetical protein